MFISGVCLEFAHPCGDMNWAQCCNVSFLYKSTGLGGYSTLNGTIFHSLLL